MDLFETSIKNNRFAPLAERVRPKTLDDIVGQEHLLGPGKVLRVMIEKDALQSLIFWGPPGVGKTTIARVIAGVTGAHFESISAVSTGIKEAREILAKAHDRLKFHAKRTILFIDEIHRFNKAQQDAFLPAVENGTIVLIGATTENPSFEVNSALLSRSQVFVLKGHSEESLERIIRRVFSDPLSGLPAGASIQEDAKKSLISFANGDARTLLNTIELAIAISPHGASVYFTKAMIDEAIQQKALRYDKDGEEHYNIISAFIKSMRNSDANAALYWLARMVDAGENPLFIARRMVVFASEDVGLADPLAIQVALAVFQAVDGIGMPEGRIPLAHAACYLSGAPKNNAAYQGIEAALAEVKNSGNLAVPLHLRNASTALMKNIGYGAGYQYAHDFEEKKTDMLCLPEELRGRSFIKKIAPPHIDDTPPLP